MAKGFWKKAFGPLGMKQTDVDGDEYYDEMDEEMEDYDDYDEPADELDEPSYEEPSFSRRRSKVISMPETRGESSQMKMIIFRPTSYDETQGVIDNLKSRKPIIVNLDEIDVAVEQLRRQGAGVPLDQLELDAGKLGLVGGQDLRQDHAAPGVGYADGQLSGGKVFDVGDLAVGLVPQIQQLSGSGL